MFEYTPEFQRAVLSHMFNSKEFLRKVNGSVKPDHFKGKIDAVYAEIFLDFFGKFPGDQLSLPVVMEELRKLKGKKKIAEEEEDAYLTALIEIMKPPYSPGFIEQEIGDFITARTMEGSFAQGINLMKKGQFGKAAELVGTAWLSSQKKVSDEGSRMIATFEDFCTKLDDPEFFGSKKGIPTGIRGLDEVLFHRGVGLGELFLWVGPTNSGKSPALLNCAGYQAMMGYDVLYYTLELSGELTKLRLNSCYSGEPVDNMAMNGKKVAERLRLLHSKKKFGEIILHDLPAYQLKPSHVRNHIRYYRDQGYNLKSFCVDYQGLMKSDKAISLADRRIEYGDICIELRSIAKDEQIAGFSAVQGNKGSLNKMEVDVDSVAEDYSQAMTADYVVGISQTKKERAEKHPSGAGTGKIRLFTGKNRNGKKGDNIPIWSDFTRMRLSMMDWNRMDHEVYEDPLL